eukprot:13684820-Ditylum_brightwellii.AAC.1
MIVGGAAMAEASLDGQSLPSMSRMSAQSYHMHHAHHTYHSSMRIYNPIQTLLLGQERSSSVSNISNMNCNAITIHSDPDDQEQA